jgi:hypothetical protein
MRLLVFSGVGVFWLLTASVAVAATASPREAPGASLEAWSERATSIYYDHDLELRWSKRGGDWKAAVLGTAHLIDDDEPGKVRIPVVVPLSGPQFMLVRSGGTNYVFHSREATDTALRPIFRFGTTTCAATRDVHLDNTTARGLGTMPTLATLGNILIAFDGCHVKPGQRGEIVLYSTGAEYGNQTITVHEPDPHVPLIKQPTWLPNDNTMIADFDAREIGNGSGAIIANGVATKKLTAGQLTWFANISAIPGAPRMLACATVYLKLHDDFRPGDGGKLPGFENTGQHRQNASKPEFINGRSYPNTGWGGRSPDGVHWSARTGYGRWTDTHVATHTYFYAMSPHDSYGHTDALNSPLPKGKWAAYVQCVKMNSVTPGSTVGNNDGGLLYEFLEHGITYVRNDIRWRDVDVPESQIRAFWHDVYCGGTSCGPNDPGTVSLARVTITAGRPDMTAVQAYLDRLNASGARLVRTR